jgi:hypothetical protein
MWVDEATQVWDSRRGVCLRRWVKPDRPDQGRVLAYPPGRAYLVWENFGAWWTSGVAEGALVATAVPLRAWAMFW